MVASSCRGSCVLITAKRRSIFTLLRLITQLLTSALLGQLVLITSNSQGVNVVIGRPPGLPHCLEKTVGVHTLVTHTRLTQQLWLQILYNLLPKRDRELERKQHLVVFSNFHVIDTPTTAYIMVSLWYQCDSPSSELCEADMTWL